MQEVGARIRQMRLAKGLTLREASKRCGVPASTLSNIESKSHAISLKNLAAIAAAFGVTPSAFFNEEAALTEEKVPAGRRLTYQFPGLTAELLTRQNDPAGLQVLLLHFAPGAAQPAAEPHSGWEYLFVLEGEAEVLVEGREPVRVAKDDFFYFRSDRPHAVKALRKTEMLLVGFGVGLLSGRR